MEPMETVLSVYILGFGVWFTFHFGEKNFVKQSFLWPIFFLDNIFNFLPGKRTRE